MKRRIGRILAVALLLILAAVIGSWLLARGTPGWYRRRLADNARSGHEVFQRGMDKLLSVQGQAADAHGRAIQSMQGGSPATQAATPIELTISDSELNALFKDWGSHRGWPGVYERFVLDPVVVFQDGRIIFAGRATKLDRVVSVHLQPRLTDDGKLDLRIARIQLGQLPMPQMMVAQQRDSAIVALLHGLRQQQEEAKIEPNGSSNNSAMAVGVMRLALDSLNGRVSEPVFFLPLEPGRGIPVRLRSIRIEGETLHVSVQPLPVEANGELLEWIRRP